MLTFFVALVLGVVLLRHWRAAGAVLLVVAFALLVVGIFTVMQGMHAVRPGDPASLRPSPSDTSHPVVVLRPGQPATT